MIKFVLPNSRDFCPIFVQIAQMGIILPRWVLILPKYHHQPLFFTQQSLNPFGDMYKHETHPTPPQNTAFPGLILKVGKMNYCLGKMDPIWAKCLKGGQNFSRSGQKKIIHYNVIMKADSLHIT